MIDFKGFFYLYTFTSVPNLDAFGQFEDRGENYRPVI
ncbi:hypothetical protein SE1_01121 [Enterococcus hirae EnGen0127]|nr:hypothetical protein SE1_01121 [Enterococcus hirae EnGen0127]